MDHVYTLLMLMVPCSVLCGDIPAPVNLTMDSYHFIHLIEWQAGPGSPEGLHYSVMIRSVREIWKMVDGCRAVHSPLRCNLTEVLSNLHETYYVNVTAILGNKTSTPSLYPSFKPIDITVPELPSLQVSPCNDMLCVYLLSPSERLDAAYKEFKYRLNVTNEKGVQFSTYTKGLNKVPLKVAQGLKYCVSVSIEGRPSASKLPVCASQPAAVNNLDVVISVVLCLLMLLIGVMGPGLLCFKHFIWLKTQQPFVLSSFKAPYKVQLISWPTVESVKHISLEPNMYKEVQVNEDLEQEKEDEEVAYEGRNGCEEVVCCEEISEEPKFSLAVYPETQHEHTHFPVTETSTPVPETLLTPDITLPREATTHPQIKSHILTTHLLPLKMSVQELKKNDLILFMRGDALEQEEEEKDKEDSENVNFFSLTLRGHNSEQQDETANEEKMEDVNEMNPKIPLFVLASPKLAMEIQPTYSESTDKHISYSEGEEEEDTGEEDAFSGYMMRS